MASTQSASDVLDRNFLDIRAKLIEIAAALDRIERADSDGLVRSDPRLGQIQRCLDILKEKGDHRAEQIQMAFSDEYDPEWTSPDYS